MIGIKACVLHSKIEINSPLEMLWLSCERSQGLILGVCYRPPK